MWKEIAMVVWMPVVEVIIAMGLMKADLSGRSVKRGNRLCGKK